MKRMLMRDSKRKTLGGVCAGIGKHTDTDPILWKLIFIFGVFTPFPMILTYIIMWIVIPSDSKVEPINYGYQPKDDLDTENPPKAEEK